MLALNLIDLSLIIIIRIEVFFECCILFAMQARQRVAMTAQFRVRFILVFPLNYICIIFNVKTLWNFSTISIVTHYFIWYFPLNCRRLSLFLKQMFHFDSPSKFVRLFIRSFWCYWIRFDMDSFFVAYVIIIISLAGIVNMYFGLGNVY